MSGLFITKSRLLTDLIPIPLINPTTLYYRLVVYDPIRRNQWLSGRGIVRYPCIWTVNSRQLHPEFWNLPLIDCTSLPCLTVLIDNTVLKDKTRTGHHPVSPPVPCLP